MRTPSKLILLAVALCTLLACAATAGAVTLTAGTATGQVGETIEIPITLTDLAASPSGPWNST